MEGVPPLACHQFITLGIASERPLREAAGRLPRQVRLLAALALGLAFLTALAAARDLLRPVLALVRSLECVWRGDFSRRVDPERADEVGDLCVAYNGMVQGLAEGRLLGRMVSGSARAAVQTGVGEGAGARGETRTMVVLYLEQAGAEEAAAREAPEEVMARLDRQVRRVCAVVGEAGGDVDKIMGGKLLAVFSGEGADLAGAAARAVEACRRLSGEHARGELPFPLRAGVSCGPVLAGFLGTAVRRDHTVIGDTVNLAARCESVAATLPAEPRIVLTGEVRALLGPAFPARLLPTRTVKGKSEPVELYQPENGATTGAKKVMCPHNRGPLRS
ncbi:MAG: adenylate/guanylate cyclase domain-containing protein [Candidatus Riflebacteria bacterium]|nr:adenylate/guanylate cyclase domain-containing protein [Candidatus Riflebacteria bacterium]